MNEKVSLHCGLNPSNHAGVTYVWEQTAGAETASLSETSTNSCTFTPRLTGNAANYTFKVTATDGVDTISDTVTVAAAEYAGSTVDASIGSFGSSLSLATVAEGYVIYDYILDGDRVYVFQTMDSTEEPSIIRGGIVTYDVSDLSNPVETGRVWFSHFNPANSSQYGKSVKKYGNTLYADTDYYLFVVDVSTDQPSVTHGISLSRWVDFEVVGTHMIGYGYESAADQAAGIVSARVANLDPSNLSGTADTYMRSFLTSYTFDIQFLSAPYGVTSMAIDGDYVYFGGWSGTNPRFEVFKGVTSSPEALLSRGAKTLLGFSTADYTVSLFARNDYVYTVSSAKRKAYSLWQANTNWPTVEELTGPLNYIGDFIGSEGDALYAVRGQTLQKLDLTNPLQPQVSMMNIWLEGNNLLQKCRVNLSRLSCVVDSGQRAIVVPSLSFSSPVAERAYEPAIEGRAPMYDFHFYTNGATEVLAVLGDVGIEFVNWADTSEVYYDGFGGSRSSYVSMLVDPVDELLYVSKSQTGPSVLPKLRRYDLSRSLTGGATDATVRELTDDFYDLARAHSSTPLSHLYGKGFGSTEYAILDTDLATFGDETLITEPGWSRGMGGVQNENRLYQARTTGPGEYALYVLDITSPEAPLTLSSSTVIPRVVDINIANDRQDTDYLALAAADEGVSIRTAADGSGYQQIWQNQGINSFAAKVYTAGTRLYVVDTYHGVKVFDTSDPQATYLIQSYATPDFPKSVAFNNGDVYVNGKFAIERLPAMEVMSDQQYASVASGTVLTYDLTWVGVDASQAKCFVSTGTCSVTFNLASQSAQVQWNTTGLSTAAEIQVMVGNSSDFAVFRDRIHSF